IEQGKETLAKIEVKNHDNGSLCPKAHFHNRITVEQVLKAPIVAWPLGLFDCCGNSDGAACAIVTTAAKARDFRSDSVYLKGFGIATDSMLPHFRPGFSWTSFDSLVKSSHKAYEMAGIKNPREELDVAEVHDCFSITELLIYEDFGFSPRGSAREDVDAGFFTREGGLPVNIDGGLKCFGHPIGASGLRMTYEVYKQLQGKADLPERQSKNPRLGLAHTFGGPPQISAVAILGSEKGYPGNRQNRLMQRQIDSAHIHSSAPASGRFLRPGPNFETRGVFGPNSGAPQKAEPGPEPSSCPLQFSACPK
ncbi:MAG: hypothetical protein JRI54_14935, partial [Deltaproteobacteria bacterium]|nr:hypothetical protein [Deltaproteobacteria bacterium]